MRDRKEDDEDEIGSVADTPVRLEEFDCYNMYIFTLGCSNLGAQVGALASGRIAEDAVRFAALKPIGRQCVRSLRISVAIFSKQGIAATTFITRFKNKTELDANCEYHMKQHATITPIQHIYQRRS